MNENVLSQQTKTRFRVPVIILSVASLMLMLFSHIDSFVYYSGYSGFEFQLPEFSSWLYFLSDLLASFLFVICALIFYKSKVSRVVMPIVLGIYAIEWIYELFNFYIPQCRLFIQGGFGVFTEIFGYTILYFIFVLVLITAAISAARGFPRKVFIIITTVIGLIMVFYLAFRYSVVFKWWIEEGLYLYFFTLFAGWFGMVFFHFSLLLFAFKDKRGLSPEQALIQLKEKLENGMITEEEYSIQRDEIINNL